MKPLHLALGVVLCATFAPDASGADDKRFCGEAKMERDFLDCLKKLDASQLREIADLDKKIRKMGDGPGFAKLADQSSRVWKAFRNAECDVKTFESRTGSGYSSILTYCLVEMNAARLVVLQERADSP